MSKIKKLLYLLQLEEYDNQRYDLWLKNNSIYHLNERKGKLKYTFRVFTLFIFSLFLNFFIKDEKSVVQANKIVEPFVKVSQSLIVFMAKLKLNFYPNLITIVVTGSYGKTTFKEMLAWVLREKYQILKTEGNQNTKISIAQLILLRLNKDHQIFIVEAGAYQRGDIADICRLVKPSYGVITIFGFMHLERFGSFNKIKETKLELTDFILSENFFLPKADHEFIDFEKTIIKLSKNLDIPEKEVLAKLSGFQKPTHRQEVVEINSKVKIIDDCYNSNPLGFARALSELKKYQGWQKVVVTPGMIELGQKQELLNREAAAETAKVADIFVVVGQTNKKALEAGFKNNKKKEAKMIYLEPAADYYQLISSLLRPPTVILLENDLPDHYF